ncbi:unnamed protein product (macronuclear) [Paramecium tetraurelia]|uniref:Uncharacterized protein n=1 Tax=Paramecium tetraurelia TaxID=5888 RepID=A0CEN4_PARTE|nr:uncharacterized protein GSPATT00037690001 [Paramecium tetraurelia]CAK69251.1 unnamed protein product [Paramecium tetraurelia]|eukprot:XP_001436648.1 hypothetical protein (macronuclear) [Paramecium tetraurelia strain d4-2]
MSQETLNGINGILSDVQSFGQESYRFMRKCTKPDKREYIKIATSCAIGFAVMGAVGYFIKLVFIPINNIILSAN